MGELFEQLTTGSGRVVTGICYHWSDPAYPEFARKSLDPTRSLSLSDEYYSWANYEHGGRLYKLTCAYHRPLVLLNQLADFHICFPYGEDTLYTKLLEVARFDAVVYTPHEYGRDRRQGLLMNPTRQVLTIREVTDYDRDLIEAYRAKMNNRWREYMSKSLAPSVTT